MSVIWMTHFYNYPSNSSLNVTPLSLKKSIEKKMKVAKGIVKPKTIGIAVVMHNP